MNLNDSEEENYSKILDNNSECLVSQYKELLEMGKNFMKFDESLAYLWDKNVVLPHSQLPYRVYNNIDNETLPYLRVGNFHLKFHLYFIVS